MSDGICSTCVTACCAWRGDLVFDCSHYTPKFETNYELLFGTPERAARTLYGIKCGEKSCKGCPIAEPCAECDVMHDDGELLRAALLEWLRGDA